MSPDWNPDQYAKNARFVSDYGLDVLEWLFARPGERILDLGCGDGALTKAIMELGASVVGVDRSPDMVRAALARGIDARMMSGDALTFASEFDAVFSNAALHWMNADPPAVVEGVFRALKPNGRFVGEFGGQGNVASIVAALNDAIRRQGIDLEGFSPWYFPTPDEYAAVLGNAGFKVEQMTLKPRPTLLPTGMEGWLQTFGKPFFVRCPSESVPAIIAETVDKLRPSLQDVRGVWTADYVRLRFAASKP